MTHPDDPPARHILELTDDEFDALCQRAARDADLDCARNRSIDDARQLHADGAICLDALQRALQRAHRRDPLLLAAVDDCLRTQLAQRGINPPTPA